MMSHFQAPMTPAKSNFYNSSEVWLKDTFSEQIFDASCAVVLYTQRQYVALNWIIFPKFLKNHVFDGNAFLWKIKITTQDFVLLLYKGLSNLRLYLL